MKHTKKLLSLLLVLCLILSLSCTAFAADEAKPLTGKTVILHSKLERRARCDRPVCGHGIPEGRL